MAIEVRRCFATLPHGIRAFRFIKKADHQARDRSRVPPVRDHQARAPAQMVRDQVRVQDQDQQPVRAQVRESQAKAPDRDPAAGAVRTRRVTGPWKAEPPGENFGIA